MQGIRRKIVFVALYEGIAIACLTTGLAAASGQGAAHAGIAAVASSVIAITWNFVYNMLFEAWEARQRTRGRGLARRIAHAVGYESALLLVGIPLFAWWLHMPLAEAFALNVGSVAFFLVYSFAFNWAFDAVFGLPTAAA